MTDLDPSLLQDFLTESGELIEQLDADLVKLEGVEAEQQAELLNACFRALHTIKGAASFLALDEVITFAHVAEDALNKLRKGEAEVTPGVMDTLLQSADVVRTQIDALSAGDAASPAPDDLIKELQAIIDGVDGGSAATDEPEATPTAAAEPEDDGLPGVPLELPPQKADLVEFMAADLQDYAGQLDDVASQLLNDASRDEGAICLAEISDNLAKTAEFFELDDLTSAIKLLVDLAGPAASLEGDGAAEAAVRVQAVGHLITEQAEWMQKGRALQFNVEAIGERLRTVVAGEALPGDVAMKHGGSPEAVLTLDGVKAGDMPAEPVAEPTVDVAEATVAVPAAAEPPKEATPAVDTPAPAKEEAKAAPAASTGKAIAEATIRVEVSRLESLLNLVGQLVLNKNRLVGLTRSSRDAGLEPEPAEALVNAAGELDRLTSELQVGVMRTRMQPLAKLFDRYPRVIRDIARATSKKIDLQIEGKDTEVDKSVLEALADPLVHILRNSADHGVEMPDTRKEAGKSASGTIRLVAEHQGSHVRVAIIDDGKGLDREVLGAKAVERGMVTADQLAKLSDPEVFRFIFEAGFSTAKQVSDLSGRGVGMDVVRTNIAKINGTINIDSTKGKGTTIEILIPLTVAIMPAMVVVVGSEWYCVPLQSVVEIVGLEGVQSHTVCGQRVMRLRDAVLPLVDLRNRLHESQEQEPKFAVVVGVGGKQAGLCVDRLVGQQEIVIKPLDDEFSQDGPFSGATIQEDGRVSLILDIVALLRGTDDLAMAEGALAQAA